MTPDGTGQYAPAGIHNGKTYYRRGDGAYFIWWDNITDWIISTGLDVSIPGHWSKSGDPVDGVYIPRLDYLGIPTVAEI